MTESRHTTDRRALLFAALASPAVAAALTARGAQAADPAVGVTVIAEILAKPERAAEVRAVLRPFAETTRGEAGCLHYALYEDPGAPGCFFTFERWADTAALDAHLNSPAMKQAGPAFAPLLAAPPAIHRLETLSA
jgi:quinol monooxygenase YgiN